MIQTLATLMVGAMLTGAVLILGGVMIMSKKFGETPAEFVQGFCNGFVQGLTAPQPETVVAPAPQHLNVSPGATAAVTARPGKGSALVLLVLALLYLVSPLDFIPDLIPGLCHLDDLGIMTFAVRNALKAFS